MKFDQFNLLKVSFFYFTHIFWVARGTFWGSLECFRIFAPPTSSLAHTIYKIQHKFSGLGNVVLLGERCFDSVKDFFRLIEVFGNVIISPRWPFFLSLLMFLTMWLISDRLDDPYWNWCWVDVSSCSLALLLRYWIEILNQSSLKLPTFTNFIF